MAKSAYEKMFEDGSAFKPIKINQPTPDNQVGAVATSQTENINPDLFEQNNMDDVIEKAKRLKAMKNGGTLEESNPVRYNGNLSPEKNMTPKVENKKVKELERRISMLEQALQLVMETQTKLLKESN